MNLPLGIADFALIREGAYYYADKTRFIPALEDASKGRRYCSFLRPRRFGKSTLLSMLHSYYDVAGAGAFDRLFRGLYIHEHPTREKSSYLILHLEFTGLSAEGGVAGIRADFLKRVRYKISEFFTRYESIIPEIARRWREDPEQSEQPAILMAGFLSVLGQSPHKLYLLVDEYDSFATDIIAQGQESLYHALVESTGFVREFYKVVKEGAGMGTIYRALLTGVLPVMLYDMASGFNILTYISRDPDLNALCGLTQDEVASLYDQIIEDRPMPRPREDVLLDLRRYYNGYRFHEEASERMYNPEMVFYFLRKLSTEGKYPASLLPPNTNMVYSRLRSLIFPTGAPQPGPLKELRALFSTGHMDAYLHDVFPLREAHAPQYFASYLYYQGLLTIVGPFENQIRLEVPNAVIQGQHGEALAALLARAGGIEVGNNQVQHAVDRMAMEGDPVPFLRLLHSGVLSRLSRRDLIKIDEKSVKLLVLGYLSLSSLFLAYSERELSGGYADLVLLCNRGYPAAQYSFVIELKYVRLTDAPPAAASTGKGKAVAKPKRRSAKVLLAAVEEKMVEAEAQLGRYLLDPRLREEGGPRGWRTLPLVFTGFDDVYFRFPGEKTRAISACPDDEEED